MVAFLPLALGAAGALAAFAKNRQYRPVLESNDTTGSILDIAGAGLGGFLGGQALGGQGGEGGQGGGGLGGLEALLGGGGGGQQGGGGLEGLLGGLLGGGGGQQQQLNLPQQQQGAPRFIPQDQLAQGIAPGESGGIPDELGGGVLQQLAQLSQQNVNRQQTSQGGGLGNLLGLLGG